MSEKILLIDAHPVYAPKIVAFLQDLKFENVRVVSSGREAIKHLTTYCPTVVILSGALPDANSLGILQHIREYSSALPIIVQVGLKTDETAIAAFQSAGAFRVIPRLEKDLRELKTAIADAVPIA